MNVVVVPPRWLRVVLTSFRTATTVGAMTLLLGFAAVDVLDAPQPAEPEQIGLSTSPLDAMMEHNRCSYTGFARDVIPDKAIIRTPEGATRLVSFDHGWAVFSGESAGDLVAVCLGPKRPATARTLS